ncbi:MAG: class I tRNA ligase family protein, partial [Hyphomicrobium sp.]|nr:class I tRNA ligase family protein [Hyphomicrobium sp.]
SKIEYGLYEVTASPEGNWAKVGDKLVLADKLAADVMKAAKVEAYEKRATVSAPDLANIVCAHPLRDAGLGGYQFNVPLLDGDHVTDDAGTGFVHTAPGHGREDFDIWTASTRLLQSRDVDPTIPYTVDENGAFTKDAPGFEGKRVITDKGEKGDANQAVIDALVKAGMLLARGRLKHQYPHSWRSKKPVICRNTPQWFIHMDKEIPFREKISRGLRAKTASTSGTGHNQPIPKTLREVSLQSIRDTEWVPKSGENRITGMIEAKPDYNPADFEKVNDVLDVWFDSGSTHSYVLNDPHFPSLMGIERQVDGGRDRVMYLEGSDQHRGWFHSSLIE